MNNWKESRAEAEMRASGEKIMKEAREKSRTVKRVKEEIYSKDFPSNYEIKFSDLPKEIQENDIIVVIYDEGHFSENNSWDPYTRLEIHRYRDETEAERVERESESEKMKEELKRRRYETYLKLKDEFEKSELP